MTYYGYHVTHYRSISEGIKVRPNNRSRVDREVERFFDRTSDNLGINRSKVNSFFMFPDIDVARYHADRDLIVAEFKLTGSERVRHQVWSYLANSRYRAIMGDEIVRSYWENDLSLSDYLRDTRKLDLINQAGIDLMPPSRLPLYHQHEIVIPSSRVSDYSYSWL